MQNAYFGSLEIPELENNSVIHSPRVESVLHFSPVYNNLHVKSQPQLHVQNSPIQRPFKQQIQKTIQIQQKPNQTKPVVLNLNYNNKFANYNANRMKRVLQEAEKAKNGRQWRVK
ncbi:Hypothetical_protein [Hexamita inflata]|uniref:Hypothetical_protein n=1 Tax=Hexamita inflata TaxID=28002 RepID=A0AA86RJD4_9EUKA|nr:Hypothetical protein HINF_LOCUS55510 [Hexamita inflata]